MGLILFLVARIRDITCRLDRLQTIGFTRAGHWTADNGKLDFSLNGTATANNVLYALVVDGEVMYVGKSVRTLGQRMRNYKTPGPTQRTSRRVYRLLSEVLSAGKEAEIYALHDNGLLYYGGFHVNLAAGLEDSIIRELEPEWNLVGKSMQ